VHRDRLASNPRRVAQHHVDADDEHRHPDHDRQPQPLSLSRGEIHRDPRSTDYDVINEPFDDRHGEDGSHRPEHKADDEASAVAVVIAHFV
jgi:hypothetical protein